MTDRVLRILHVQHSLHPGGMENGVVNIANALASKGFEFHVACLSSSGGFATRLPNPSFVYSLNKEEGFSWRTVRALQHLIQEINPDVLHSHNLGALLYTALGSKLGRAYPILHGEHGVPDDGPDSRRRHIQRRLFFPLARKVHTVSRSLHEHFLAAGFAQSKLIPLVNGVDTKRYQPGNTKQARRALNLPEDAPVLLIVGRLIASKRHLLLFEALQEISDEFPDVILLVLGDGGPDRDAIYQSAQQSRCSANIRMEGYQSDPLPYYQAADLLVAPSRVEGLSNAVLEAMACELPALLDDACGNLEVIEDGRQGVVTPLDTPSALASHIKRLLNDQALLKDYGKQARKKVTSKYSLARMAEAYESTYRLLANNPR